MAKTTEKPSVKVTTVIPAKENKKTEKPKSPMFISGPLQIPVAFSFTKEEFLARFSGQKLGGKDINTVYDEYSAWCKKNK